MKRSRLRYTIVALLVAAPVCAAEVPGAATDAQAQAVYFGCATCHGENGEGRMPRHAPRIAGQDAAYLKRQMEAFRSGSRGGHPDDAYGKHMTLMAATVVDDALLSALTDFVARLPAVPARTTLAGNNARGAMLYQPCAVCHGAAGEGAPALGAPRLAGFDDWYLLRQLRNYRAGIRGGRESDAAALQMAAQAASLSSEQDLLDLVSFVTIAQTHTH